MTGSRHVIAAAGAAVVLASEALLHAGCTPEPKLIAGLEGRDIVVQLCEPVRLAQVRVIQCAFDSGSFDDRHQLVQAG